MDVLTNERNDGPRCRKRRIRNWRFVVAQKNTRRCKQPSNAKERQQREISGYLVKQRVMLHVLSSRNRDNEPCDENYVQNAERPTIADLRREWNPCAHNQDQRDSCRH